MRTLTHLTFVALLATVLTGCSTATPQQASPRHAWANHRLVVIGDSISAGAAASRADRGYVAILTQRLTDYTITNYSRGGWSVRASRNWVAPAYIDGVPPLWPNDVIIVLGTNDFSADEPLDDFVVGYRALLDRLLRSLVIPIDHLFCVTPFPREDEDRANMAGHILHDYRLVIEKECSTIGGIPLDGSQAMPNSIDYRNDTVHPNDSGHARIAAWLLEELRTHGVGQRSQPASFRGRTELRIHRKGLKW